MYCFYNIFAKKPNSHHHFKYIKKHKIKIRNSCFAVITLCSPKVIFCPYSTVIINVLFSINFQHPKPKHYRFQGLFFWKAITSWSVWLAYFFMTNVKFFASKLCSVKKDWIIFFCLIKSSDIIFVLPAFYLTIRPIISAKNFIKQTLPFLLQITDCDDIAIVPDDESQEKGNIIQRWNHIVRNACFNSSLKLH